MIEAIARILSQYRRGIITQQEAIMDLLDVTEPPRQ